MRTDRGLPDGLSLSQGTINLVVEYRHVTEDANTCCRNGLPEGRVAGSGTVMGAGRMCLS